MVAGSGDGMTGADRGSGSASSRLRRGSLVILALAACLLLAVAVGTRGSPGGALPLPATPAVWQTACYFLVGSVVGVGLAGLPIALGIQRRRAAAGAYEAASWWQRLAAVALSDRAPGRRSRRGGTRHPLTSGRGRRDGRRDAI